MTIQYNIGDVYKSKLRTRQFRISGITIKADESIKIRLTEIPNNCGVFEVTEKTFINDYEKVMSKEEYNNRTIYGSCYMDTYKPM